MEQFNETSLKNDIIELEKLDLKDGNIIILKVDEETHTSKVFKEKLMSLSKIFFKQLRKRIFFFILKPEHEISISDQEEMEKTGWIRKEKVIKDFQLLLALVPNWVDNIEEGLDPTFYETNTYEGDLMLKQRVDGIRKFVKGDKNDN
jgi:hypothetical protein